MASQPHLREASTPESEIKVQQVSITMPHPTRPTASMKRNAAARKPVEHFERLEARELFSVATPAKVGSTPWVPYATLIHQDLAVQNYPWLTGAGQTIAIVDRGIDFRNDPLGNGFGPGFKVSTGYNFRDLNKITLDDYGHGTGVASIIGANAYTTDDVNTGITEKNQGIAPGASLASLKQESSANIKSALDWVIQYHAKLNIQVVNLTDFITEVANGAWNPNLYASELQTLHSLNIFVATPVGNGEANYGPGVPIDMPATSPYVMGAGGVNIDNTMWNDSRRGNGLDILAPSNNVTMVYYLRNTQVQGYSQYDDNYSGSDAIVNYAKGTSWASAYTTGTAALIKQVDPLLTPDQIMTILEQSGTPVQDPEHPGTYYPRLDVNAAIGQAYYTADDALSKAYNNTRNSRAVPLTFKKNRVNLVGEKLLIKRADAYSFTLTDTRTLTINFTYSGTSAFPSGTIYNSRGQVVSNFGSKGYTGKFGPGTYYIDANAPAATLIGTYGVSIGTVSIQATAARATPQAVKSTSVFSTSTATDSGGTDVLLSSDRRSVFAS